MQRDDDVLALDMVLAIRQIQSYVGSMSREAFDQSKLHQDAVIRQCTIIGEAARNFSTDFRSAHPEIPWPKLIGFRNRLAHAYFNVDLDTVWDTIQKDFPVLLSIVQPLVPPETPDTEEI